MSTQNALHQLAHAFCMLASRDLMRGVTEVPFDVNGQNMAVQPQWPQDAG